MDILSLIFGREIDDAARQKIADYYEYLIKIMDDEDVQWLLTIDSIKNVIKSGTDCDKLPNGEGEFGLCEKNPIPVNGPIGELAYMSRLTTELDEPLLFHRIGSVKAIDMYEAVTFDTNEWHIFFLDFYHPKRSKLAPEGFKLVDHAMQFSGFHVCCQNFPYDFPAMKNCIKGILGHAYIPISYIETQLRNRMYTRPVEHVKKLIEFQFVFNMQLNQAFMRKYKR